VPGGELKFLQKKCAEWKKILRLEDWNIELRFCMPPREKAPTTLFGMARIANQIRRAVIFITPKKDIDLEGCDGYAFDYERTVVHELLHVKQCFLWDLAQLGGNPKRYAGVLMDEMEGQHQSLADTLVDLKRANEKAKVARKPKAKGR
jgi:hypothetical protein